MIPPDALPEVLLGAVLRALEEEGRLRRELGQGGDRGDAFRRRAKILLRARETLQGWRQGELTADAAASVLDALVDHGSRMAS